MTAEVPLSREKPPKCWRAALSPSLFSPPFLFSSKSLFLSSETYRADKESE